ncbi:MAG TPA: hypothetical protein VMU36_07200, partial [Spirochaetia bacterium]|nr:hypothetical protein [Spirochaetia bacterium]
FSTDPQLGFEPSPPPDMIGHAASPTASVSTILAILNSGTTYYFGAIQDAAGAGGTPAVNDPVLIYNGKGVSLANGVENGGATPYSVTSNQTITFTLTDTIKIAP